VAVSAPPEGPPSTIYDAIGNRAMAAAMGTATNESATAGGERPVAGILILFFPTRISQVVAGNGDPVQREALTRAAGLAVESLQAPPPAPSSGGLVH
jgi:hypothetical protein